MNITRHHREIKRACASRVMIGASYERTARAFNYDDHTSIIYLCKRYGGDPEVLRILGLILARMTKTSKGEAA